MVKKLMEVDGSLNFFRVALTESMSFTKKMMPEEKDFQAFIDEILSEVNIPKKMAVIYKEYYEADDILALISFFRSPTGKKIIKFQSQVLPRVTINTQLIAAEMMVVALRKIAERFPNTNGIPPQDHWDGADEDKEDDGDEEGQDI